MIIYYLLKRKKVNLIISKVSMRLGFDRGLGIGWIGNRGESIDPV